MVWKKSSSVVHMEDILARDPRRTIMGFQADKSFIWLAPKFSFDDPNEEEEDCMSKLLDAEMVAAVWKRADETAKALRDAREKEKEKEKEKETRKEMGLSGSAKGKGKESKCEVHSESEEEEEEDNDKPQSCIYCVKKKIPCMPQNGKKVCVTSVHEKVAEAMRELTKLEWCRTASLLEKSWYDLDIYTLNLEQTVDRDLMEVDGKVLTLLDMKSRRVEILPEVEKRIMTNHGSIVVLYTTHMEHIFEWMNLIQKRTVWTKNGLPDSTLGESVAGPSSCVEASGNKRKAEESESHAEESDKKKRRVVDTEEENSTMH
ncbi:hypothetical protein M422DRAFT_261762 [Sphaerobolus stellatus SS14]|uniref:Uncharacterized protein n=1 Tax=Sphaerobolus stellatus (strain SS14) TaxID=990650 RepID=A0A0C9V2T9_SPHS4|nr:hypothetical protein M422DRAFT_261762 [Sphaerobolus stellatus SS14]